MPLASLSTTEPALLCPKCGASIQLTESLAAPLVAATRAQYEQQLADQAKVFAAEKQTVNSQREANDRRAAELEASARKQQQDVALAVEEQVADKLVNDRKRITEEASVRARQQVEDKFQKERDAAASQRHRIQTLTQKLTLAQAAEADS